MISQPNNIDFATLDSVLKGIGCMVRNKGSSHFFYKQPNSSTSITIPKAKPVLKCYIIQVIKLFRLKEIYDEIT